MSALPQLIGLRSKLEKHFLKADNKAEKNLKFQKELWWYMSDYLNAHNQLIKQALSEKLITEYMITKNKWSLIIWDDLSTITNPSWKVKVRFQLRGVIRDCINFKNMSIFKTSKDTIVKRTIRITGFQYRGLYGSRSREYPDPNHFQ